MLYETLDELLESTEIASAVLLPRAPYINQSLFDMYTEAGWRFATVAVHTSLFGGAIHRPMIYFVKYCNNNFNVDIPKGEKFPFRRFSVADIIGQEFLDNGDKTDDEFYTPLTDEQHDYLPYLPTGWNSNDSSVYTALYAGKQTLIRLHWNTSYLFNPEIVPIFIHPFLDRPLTKSEYLRLTCGIENANHWMRSQLSYCVAGAWGAQDWGTVYDAQTGRFNTEHFTTKPVNKLFDLMTYYPARGYGQGWALPSIGYDWHNSPNARLFKQGV